MRKSRAIAIPVLLLLAELPMAAQVPVAPPSTAPTAAPTPAKLTPLGDTGLSMALPAGCEPGDAKAAGLRFTALRAAGDRHGLAINLGDQGGKLPEQLDPVALTKEFAAMLAKSLANYAVAGDGLRKVLGKDAYWLSGTFESEGASLRNLQVMLPTDPGFCITFLTAADAYADVLPEIEAALATLQASPELLAAKVKAPRREGARLHVDAQGFSIEPPAGWEVGDAGVAMGAFLLVLGPVDQAFAANLNVRENPAIPKLDVPAMAKELRAQLPRVLDQCKVEEVTGVKLGKLQCLRTRATYKMPTGDVAMVQYIVPGAGKSFVATYTTTKAAMAKAYPAIEKSAATILLAPAENQAADAKSGAKPGAKPADAKPPANPPKGKK